MSILTPTTAGLNGTQLSEKIGATTLESGLKSAPMSSESTLPVDGLGRTEGENVSRSKLATSPMPGEKESDSLADASYKRVYLNPPPVQEPYSPEIALEDLPGVSYALETFLASHMLESEEYCNKSDPEK
jgi:hypothetical protein